MPPPPPGFTLVEDQAPAGAASTSAKVPNGFTLTNDRVAPEKLAQLKQKLPARPLNQQSDYQQSIQNASKRYPRLSPYLSNTIIESKQRPKGEPSDAQLETLPPWEDWNPNKGKTTVQLYEPYTDMETMSTALAGDMFHIIGGIDGRTKKPVDPEYFALKQKMIAARSPKQDTLDRKIWKEEEGEHGRTYEDWLQESRADAYIRGMLTPSMTGKYADEWRKQGVYSSNPKLKGAIEDIDKYLKSTPSVGSADEAEDAPMHQPKAALPAGFTIVPKAKMDPLIASRVSLYKEAVKNGFAPQVAAKTAVTEAVGLAPDPSNWKKIVSAVGKIPTGMRSAPLLSDVGDAAGEWLHRAWDNPLAMSDENWQKAQNEFGQFIDKQKAAFGPGMGSEVTAGAYKGAFNFAGTMLAPGQIALAVGTFGESALVRAGASLGIEGAVPAARTLAKLMQVNFAAQMVEGTASGIENTVKAAQRGDWQSVGESAIDGLVSGVMAKGLASHEMAQSKVRGDLEKTAREMHGAPAGNPVTGALTSRFDQLDPYTQGVVIHDTVEKSPEYKALLDQADKTTQREARKRQQRYTDYHETALSQAWEPDTAKRVMQGIERSGEMTAEANGQEAARQHYIKQVVSTLKNATERQTALVEEQRQEEDRARQEGREARPQRKAEAGEQRKVILANAKQIADARSAAATTREKSDAERTQEKGGPSRPINSQIEETKEGPHHSYVASYFGEENRFGVTADMDHMGVYRETPRGIEYLNQHGLYSPSIEDVYVAPDEDTGQTVAKISSLRYEAESNKYAKEESFLSSLQEAVISGEKTAEQARKEAGILDKIELPTEVDALRAGDLKGPLADKTPEEFFNDMAGASTEELSSGEKELLKQEAGVLVRMETENNLHHIARSGDFVTSKKGVRWTLDSQGMLHPEDGSAPFPLMKDGRYSGQAMQLGMSGPVGYGGRTREQRRADTARQRAIQSMIDDIKPEISAAIDHVLKVAQQNAGLEQTPENLPSEMEEKKKERAKLFGPPDPATAQARQSAIGIAALVRDGLEKSGAAEVVNAIAKDNGVDVEEVLRQKLAQDDSPRGKAASLQVGDKIHDPFRKDRPWVVEESKAGGLQLRSGNANPLPLDRLNPNERVLGMLRNGGLEQDRPINDQDVTFTAYDAPHVVYRDSLVEKVREFQNGKPIPEPATPIEARAMAADSEHRTNAAVSKATETQRDAQDPPPGTTVEEAENKVDEAEQDLKTAEAAQVQEAEIKAKTVPKDPFPPRAPVSVGLRGNSGVIKQNGRELPMHYEMVPLEALLTSHTWQGNQLVQNLEFPPELQPRTISDQESKQNVMRARPRTTDDRGMTTGYDFAEYGDRTINAQMGPAIIEDGGRVVGGNTRIAIMRRHLEYLNEIQDTIDREVALAMFREQMRQLARENGITPTLDEANHVVVRALDQPIETLRDAADLGRLLNKSISVQMTASAKGVSYSKSLTDENLSTLGRLVEEHDGLPGAISANPEYFSNLVTNNFGIVPSEYADWFDSDTAKGLVLNEAGRRQFGKALLGTIFKDTSVLSRVEDTAPYRALERALPYLVKMRSIADRNLTPKLIDAVSASAETMDVDPGKSNSRDKWAATYKPDQAEFLGMESPTPPEPDRIVETLWRALHAGPRTLNDRLKNWIGEESASNISMFAVHETPAEMFSRVFAKELREVAYSRGDKDSSIPQAEYDSMLRNVELSKEAREEAKRAEDGKPPKKAATKEEKQKKGFLSPPGTEPEKPVTPEKKIAQEKTEKGYVTPTELKTFLGAQEATKDHVPTIMRTAQMMAEYVFDADPPEGMDRKDALAWILKERVAKLEVGGKGRGSYSDPLIEKGIGTGILRLAKAHDETTFIHEFAHVIFPLLSEADHRDLNTIHDSKIPQWDHDQPLKGEAYKGLSEKFAHGLERFLRDENPTGFAGEVKKVLAKVKEIFRKAYFRFAGDPLNTFELSEEAKGVFANMFGVTDFDVADRWRDEVKKAKSEGKGLTSPAAEPHPIVKIARDMGAAGLRKTYAGKVEETVGDRVDPKKPTAVLYYLNEETAKAAWLDVGTPGSKIQDAELIAGEDGTYGIRINTSTKMPTDVLYQEIPRKHPGIELEEAKAKLAKMPESTPIARKLLQLKIQNLENEIRARFRDEDLKPEDTKETVKAAVEEKKNGANGKQAVSDVRRLPEANTGDLGRRTTREVPKLTLLGRQDDATVRGAGGPLPGTRTLTGVRPVSLEPIAPRGEATGILAGDKLEAKAWLDGLRKAGLPENSPPPTVPISRETASQLKYAGQKQIVQLAMSALEQGDGFVIASSTGSGKCLGKGTPVMLADGTVIPVEDVIVGDQLMGPDSKPRTVLSLANGYDRMYRVIPVKGDPYVVNEAHILSLKMTGVPKWKGRKKGDIVNISITDYMQSSATMKHWLKGYRVGVDFPRRSVPMDPYILGLWLGDGTAIRPSLTTADPEILGFWTEYVHSQRCRIRRDNIRPGCTEYTAVAYEKGKTPTKNLVVAALQVLEVIGNKHVPFIYKSNDKRIRLRLLAGLMDTDGSLSVGGFDFISKWRVLAEDVVFLARSLGFAAYLAPCKKTCTNNGKVGSYYRVSISGDTPRIPCQVRRKQAGARKQIKDVLVTGLRIEPIGVGEYFGFHIDGDRLFLLGDFTVTHNTYTSMAVVKEFMNASPGAKVLIITKNVGLLRNSAKVGKERFSFDTYTGSISGKTLDVSRGTIFGTTYQRLLGNDIYKKTEWDLVIADESGEMRNWFREENRQGKEGIAVIDKAKKAVYVSATPFHSPAEYGYVKKLNLWPKNQFDKWIADNFAHEKLGDKIVAKLDPGKQAKLRQQMIERGQFVSQMISYEGFTTHFGVVPIDDNVRRSLNQIHEGVARAKARLLESGKKALADRLSAFEATYTKAFLERSRLPQAIELIKKGLAAGWHPLIFSETTSEDLFRRDDEGDPGTYKKLDAEMGGELSRIIPPFPDIYDTLKASFGDQIGDYSGSDNTDAQREEAKKAFLEGRVRALYTTYAAGGIGVSLHDTDGNKPRLAIFLGPPYSGVLLEQAMGRPWRFGVKSNVHAVFLATDSEPDIQLMATKVGPRLRAVRASVLGERDSLGTVMGNYSEEQKTREQQDMLAYDQGNEVKVDAQSFQRRDKRNVRIDNWSAINIPNADTAKNKGMQIQTAGKDGDWATMYQPKNRFVRPPMSIGEMAAQRKLNDVAESIAKGTGLPPGDPLENMEPSTRETVAGGSAAVGAQAVDIPVDRDKGNAGKMAAETMYKPGWRKNTDGVWRNVGDFVERDMSGEPPPQVPEDIRTDYHLTGIFNSERMIESIASQAGRSEVGRDLVRMNRDFVQMVQKHKNDYANEIANIAVEHQLDLSDDATMSEIFDVVKGASISKDPKINKAAEQIADLNEIAMGDMGSAGVKGKKPDGTDFEYSKMQPDRNYMPQSPDWDAKIEDPLTKEVNTLKEIMGKTFSQAKRQRMLERMAAEKGTTPEVMATYLSEMKKGPPVLGHVQRARTIDFPIFKKDLNTLMRYYNQVAVAIAREKVFGGDELTKLRQTASKIPSRNGQDTIMDLYQQHFRRQDWGSFYGKAYNTMAGFEVLTKMNFSVLKVPFHLGMAPLGLGGRVTPLSKAAIRMILDHKEVKAWATAAGTLIDQQNPMVLMNEEANFSLAHWALKKEGFNAAYDQARMASGESAHIYLEQYAINDLKKDEAGTKQLLKDRLLLSDQEIDEAMIKGSFSIPAIHKGMRAYTNLTMFTENNPLQMPALARMDTSGSIPQSNFNRMVRASYVLQTFSVKAHSLIKETVIDELKKGNVKPFAYLLIAAPALGQMMKGLAAAVPSGVQRGIEDVRGMQHKKDPWDNFIDQFKGLYGDHPAIAALKIYGDGLFAQTATEVVRMFVEPFLDIAAGNTKKAGTEFEYMASDTVEQVLGPVLATLFWHTLLFGISEGKALTSKHPDVAAEKAFKRWIGGELPITRRIPTAETPDKNAASGRLSAPTL